MTAVEIEYCVPCGTLDRAKTVQRELLDRFGQDPDRVSLVTGGDGVSTVDVDGERGFDEADDGYDVDETTRRVRDRLRRRSRNGPVADPLPTRRDRRPED